MMIQRNLQASVIFVRIDRGIEFLNKTLNAFFKEEGIEHQTSTPRTPEQNGVVKRQNRTLVEAARTMLSASKLPLFFWAEAIATALDYDKPDPAPELQNVSPSADTTVPSQQELDLLLCPLYDEFFNDGTSRVNKSSSPTDNSIKKDTLPSTHIQLTSELTTLTNVHVEENNDNQAEFTNPLCTPVQETAESSSCNIGNSNVHTFNQPQDSEYRWKKDHPLTQVRGNPSKPVQTRRQLATDPEMSMQEELHQFDRLQVWELVEKPFGKNVRNRSRFGINKWYQSLALRNFDLEDMELESTNSGPTAKLPILKLGEYEMWAMRIKQYFQIQDYALWEVIENGDSWVPISQTTEENGITTSKVSTPATAEEKIKRKNDVKARGLLLMALPNEHQLTFSQYPDAKSMFAAIETRFGGNAATKKTQKTLLKQQYENFSATSAESLDSIFNRLQKIVSRLAILGVIIAQEDLNLKFLSSLPSEWNTHVVVWMNKPEIETMSIDDLYNNFKIVEQKIKKTVGTSSGGQNLAFMTAPSSSSINDANTAYSQVSAASPSVNTASPQVCTASVSDNTVYAFMVENPNGSNVLHQDLEQIHEDDLEAMDLKWQLSLLSVRAKKYYQKTGKKIFINSNDIAGYDKSKVECYNCHKLGHFARECRASRSKEDQFRNQDNTRKQGNKEDTSKAMLAIDGVGFDWSEMAEEQVQSNMALMAFSDSEVYTDKTCSKTCLNNYETLKKQYDDLLAKQLQTKFESATYKRGLDTVEAQLVTYRKNKVLFSEEVAVLKRDVEFKQYEINKLKAEFEKLKQAKDAIDFKIEKFDKASKDLDQLLGIQITDKSKMGFGYCIVPPPHPLIYNRPNKLDMSYSGLDEFKEPEFKGYGPENSKKESNIVKESDNSKENSDKSLVKELESQVSDDEEQDESITKPEKKTVTLTAAKIEKPVRKSVRYAEMYRSQRPRGNQRNWNGQKSNQLAQSTVQMPFYKKPALTSRHFNHKVNTVRHGIVNTARSYRTPVNTVRSRVINTARQNRTSVNAARANRFNAVKPSACWV
ncbi:putative ribonuclease H-like domain-containing protein [Tanacetum coccineum]